MRLSWSIPFPFMLLLTGSLLLSSGPSPLLAQENPPSRNSPLSNLTSASQPSELNQPEGLPEGFRTCTFEDAAGPHRYLVFLPRNYDPAVKWPVLLFLHGAGERGTDLDLLLTGQLAVALEKWPEMPFIAVFPQCENRTGRALTGWLADSPDGQRAMQILSQVEQTYSIDPDRRMLAGWSMGGYGAWSLAAAWPEKWSSVLVLAGGALHDQLPLEKLAQRRVPVWAISASGDPLIPWQRSQTLIEQLNKLGGHSTFTLLEGKSHDFCPRVFAASEVYEWMLNPGSRSPATIGFPVENSLPLRTKYYEQHVVEFRTISQALGLRLGNDPFVQLAPELPALLTSGPLQGTLADVQQTLGTGESEMRVGMTDLSYRCEMTELWAHGISGGRLGLEVGFQPLELTIGRTTLDSRHHTLRTGPIHIRMGTYRPAVLKLEVQPVIESGRLKLRLLRRAFTFDDGNWYIEPPTEVEGHSNRFTTDQLVTGIIGSLYGSRQDLVDRVLGVVPELIARAERELELRSAPGLARLLSPLPVLVPDVNVSPAMIRTDADGVSVVCDLKLRVRGKSDLLPLAVPLQLQDLSPDRQLSLAIDLGAMTSVSRMTVEEGAAQINVLDISEDSFAALADPHIMNDILPELHAEPQESLNVVLRLVAPMVMTGQKVETSGESARLLLTSEQVSIDVYRNEPQKPAPVPVGQILFSLTQPIHVLPPQDAASPEAAFEMVWETDCNVTFLRGESLAGSPVPRVDGKRFEEVFRKAWTSWGQAHGGREIPMTVSKVGSSRLRLHRLEASDHLLKLHLDVQTDDPKPEPITAGRR